MSEDASPLSLTRSQLAAVAVAAVIGAGALVDPSRGVTLVVAAVATAALAVRVGGRSTAERAALAVAFISRSRWTRVAAGARRDEVEIAARGRRRVALDVIEPRGRPDLSGEDASIAASLSALVERASRVGADQLVSWHVEHSGSGPVLLVARPRGVDALANATTLVAPYDLAVLTGLGRAESWVLERWRYLRTVDRVACVLVVRAGGPVAGESAALARQPGVRVSTVVRVIAEDRAQRIAGRHAVRFSADSTVSSRLGFRTRARDRLAANSIERREGDVASGRALVEISVSVLAVAASRAELEALVVDVSARARRHGMTLRRENGRHAPALCEHLPGAPAWSPR